MNKEKKIYYSDLTNLVDVCYSCKSQNIDTSNNEQLLCKDCGSEDIGAEFPQDLL